MTEPTVGSDGPALARLREVLRRLLSETGCPWDREQTPESLTEYLIEEAHELVGAIRSGNTAEVAEEIGDVLFLLLFVAELYERRGAFTLTDAIEGAAGKMVRRHPHVFDNAPVENMAELFSRWEAIKRAEKAEAAQKAGGSGDGHKGLFDSLPVSLEPTRKAYRINAKAARTGFTWKTDEAQAAQMDAEWREWLAAEASGDKAAMREEFGDWLFSAVEYGRRRGIKSAEVLDSANTKFLGRFAAMERLAAARGLELAGMDLEAMNRLWDEVKGEEATSAE